MLIDCSQSLVENKHLSLIFSKIKKLKKDHLYYGEEILTKTIYGLQNKFDKKKLKKLSRTKSDWDFLTFINELFDIYKKKTHFSYGLVVKTKTEE